MGKKGGNHIQGGFVGWREVGKLEGRRVSSWGSRKLLANGKSKVDHGVWQRQRQGAWGREAGQGGERQRTRRRQASGRGWGPRREGGRDKPESWRRK